MNLRYLKYVAAGLMLALSCRQDDGARYYRHLHQYKIHGLTFVYPIASRNHKDINCYEVRYDKNDRIVSAVYVRKGKPANDMLNEYSSIEIEYSENKEIRQVRDLDGKSVNGDIEYFTYEYSEDSLRFTVTNYSKDSSLVEDSSGVVTYLYSDDTLKNEITQFRLDIDGDTIMDYNLKYKVIFEYDESGNIVKSSNYDRSNCLQADKYGIAMTRFEYNEKNDCTDILCYDEENIRTSNTEYGCSRVTRSFDQNGDIIRVAWKDEEDSLYFYLDKGFAYYEMKYSESGDLTEIRNYNSRSKPTYISRLDESGELYEQVVYSLYIALKTYRFEKYAYKVDKYDSTGQVFETVYYDKDDTYFYKDRGYISVKFKHDDDGNVIEQAYYSEDGKHVEDKLTGVGAYRYKHDKEGNVTELRSYSVVGDPVEDSSIGIALVKYKYDEFDNRSEISNYSLDGQLKGDKEYGIAKTVNRHFDGGLSLETSFYDSDEKATVFSGCNCFRMVMDNKGDKDCMILSFYGTDGNLVFNDNEGYAFLITEFHGEGFSTRRSYFDVDSSLIVHKYFGFAIEEEDIENGKTIATRYYDADHNLIDDPRK